VKEVRGAKTKRIVLSQGSLQASGRGIKGITVLGGIELRNSQEG